MKNHYGSRYPIEHKPIPSVTCLEIAIIMAVISLAVWFIM